MMEFRPEAWIHSHYTPAQFEEAALELFRFQGSSVPVYQNYLELINVAPETVQSVSEIPFLPITFFKTHRVSSHPSTVQVFTSSGTTGSAPSRHELADVQCYERAFQLAWEASYGPAQDWCFLCLLPSYLERTGSSLIYMAEAFIKGSRHEQSGFFLNEWEALKGQLEANEKEAVPTVLLGVSFALMDFAEYVGSLELKHTVVMETGGMKGRREEWTKPALHAFLRSHLHVDTIHSEYGMTELLSQAYSHGSGRFQASPWMRVLVREMRDPFTLLPDGRSGGLNVVDLANIHSCAFIETQDIGKRFPDGTFEVLGRMDFSDLRGCNLLVD